MKRFRRVVQGLVAVALSLSARPGAAASLAEQNQALLAEMAEVHGYSPGQIDAVRGILQRSRYAGQGNPAISQHPVTPEECRGKVGERLPGYRVAAFAAICRGPYMAPLYDPAKERAEDAPVCIDQFEFPDIPCAYPVVWIRASEAAEVCQALGKRMCDAHEWEGACAGRLLAPDYRFDLARAVEPSSAVRRMREAHNRAHKAEAAWSYGPEYRKGICATSGHKTPGCAGGGWTGCGSNTFPAGAFPDCHGALGVYDLNGNAAEHMNLPLDESQMASRGSRDLGVTEMKGSWFVFEDYRAHDDWCRWRAPYWHGTRVMDKQSHHNYHLGFRCCKDVARSAEGAAPDRGGR
jgi:formylglycine-generating enzyme required for sulfatase activity